jgi:hypothetical protein
MINIFYFFYIIGTKIIEAGGPKAWLGSSIAVSKRHLDFEIKNRGASEVAITFNSNDSINYN